MTFNLNKTFFIGLIYSVTTISVSANSIGILSDKFELTIDKIKRFEVSSGYSLFNDIIVDDIEIDMDNNLSLRLDVLVNEPNSTKILIGSELDVLLAFRPNDFFASHDWYMTTFAIDQKLSKLISFFGLWKPLRIDFNYTSTKISIRTDELILGIRIHL